MNKEKHYPIKIDFKFAGNPNNDGLLLCPICDSTYNHLGTPYKILGLDNYEAPWWGRGDLLVIPIEGECVHDWALCIGFHKGMLMIFAVEIDKHGIFKES